MSRLTQWVLKNTLILFSESFNLKFKERRKMQLKIIGPVRVVCHNTLGRKSPVSKKIDISDYLAQGFNKSQATSLAWAERFSDWMDAMSGKGTGFFGPEIRIDTYCFDCKDGGQLLPDTCRMFIQRHKGHKTKTIKIR
jgi:hypothetical protein